MAFVYNRYLSTSSKPPVELCATVGVYHPVKIEDNSVSPKNTQAALCDALSITNNDDIPRLIAFGRHDNHTPYDGVAEKLLNQGETLMITLNKPGTYIFHDHLHQEVNGTFTVSN